MTSNGMECSAANDVLLEVKNIYKNFGVTIALKDVSFSLERGKVYGLIGENGSGKSTVSSIIAGMLPASQGHMVCETVIEVLSLSLSLIVTDTVTV